MSQSVDMLVEEAGRKFFVKKMVQYGLRKYDVMGELMHALADEFL